MAHADVSRKRKVGDDPEGDDDLPPPPDGGWGWMVVFASFMIHIVSFIVSVTALQALWHFNHIVLELSLPDRQQYLWTLILQTVSADGMTYSFGIFYVEFLKYFNEGKGYTAWIVSILVGVTLCSGPISSSFVNRFGCRAVTIAGAILGAVSVMVSALATNVLTLIFTVGIGAGFGFGLIYLPAIVCVTVYFERYRSLATGIAVCGSGLGTFIFAPLTETLISIYGWRGALVIIGALVLNCIIFGAMFRPLPEPKVTISAHKTSNTVGSQNKEIYMHVSSSDVTEHKSANVVNIEIADEQSMQRSRSIDHVTRSLNNGYATRGSSTLQSNGKLAEPLTEHSTETSRLARSQPALGRYDAQRTRSGSGLMLRPDVLYQGSMLSISRQEVEIASVSHRKTKRSCLARVGCGDASLAAIDKMMDFSLFSDLIFIIFAVSNFLTSVGFYIPYVYIAARAEEIGLPKDQASYCLSIIGIANSVGRIVLGYLSDKPWVNRLWVYNVCLIVCGLATALSVFCLDFYTMSLYSAVFGFTIGAYVGLTSVILVDLLGLAKLTNAFGLLLLFQGIASLLGPPAAGWLYDGLGSYDPGFYVAGIAIGLSGLMLYVIPPIQRSKAKKPLRNGTVTKDVETSLL